MTNNTPTIPQYLATMNALKDLSASYGKLADYMVNLADSAKKTNAVARIFISKMRNSGKGRYRMNFNLNVPYADENDSRPSGWELPLPLLSSPFVSRHKRTITGAVAIDFGYERNGVLTGIVSNAEEPWFAVVLHPYNLTIHTNLHRWLHYGTAIPYLTKMDRKVIEKAIGKYIRKSV